MKLAIDIPAETYKVISEWDEPKTKYAAEYMLYQFVKNGKRIEQTNCSDAISRQAAIEAVRVGALSTATLYGRSEEGETARKEIERLIKALPTISTEKTGRWILKRTSPTKLYDEHLKEYKCSECYRGIRCTESQLVNYPYCHCGARMNKGE